MRGLTAGRLDSLDHFIYENTGVPPEAIWAYLSDGRPLKADNIRELAGLEDQVRLLDSLRCRRTHNVLDNIRLQQELSQR